MATAAYTMHELLQLIRQFTPEDIVLPHDAVTIEADGCVVTLSKQQSVLFLKSVEREERRAHFHFCRAGGALRA